MKMWIFGTLRALALAAAVFFIADALPTWRLMGAVMCFGFAFLLHDETNKAAPR